MVLYINNIKEYNNHYSIEHCAFILVAVGYQRTKPRQDKPVNKVKDNRVKGKILTMENQDRGASLHICSVGFTR